MSFGDLENIPSRVALDDTNGTFNGAILEKDGYLRIPSNAKEVSQNIDISAGKVCFLRLIILFLFRWRKVSSTQKLTRPILSVTYLPATRNGTASSKGRMV